FIDAAREHGLTDGFLLPTFGPRQHIAVFSITMIDHEDRIAHADVPILHSVAQATHLRIDQLASEEVERPHLAPREITILHWIARGKSNEEIAMILGNKRPTIATHIKRIFAKLDVTDRASAAVKGLKFGLINV
ncbi:MAG TPA: LuxR family transcriptional regulator, partial [Erythrobacter sp.]|nr:LuxR family transcriptional regulator [Erythrobacter sp.]